MTDDELIAHLHKTGRNLMLGTVRQAADRIKALVEERDALRAEVETCTKYRHAYAECDRIATDALRKAEAERDRLRQLLQYVMDNRGECYIPSSNGWWDEAVQAAITTKGDADAG